MIVKVREDDEMNSPPLSRTESGHWHPIRNHPSFPMFVLTNPSA
jgi:hypothetical protein